MTKCVKLMANIQIFLKIIVVNEIFQKKTFQFYLSYVNDHGNFKCFTSEWKETIIICV